MEEQIILNQKTLKRTKNIYKIKDLDNKLNINKRLLNKYFNFNFKITKKLQENFKNIRIIKNNINKYNSTPFQKNIMNINNLLNLKENHYFAIFRDYLINDCIIELLKKFYNIKESEERISKFYYFYRNYLIYFCKPTFCEFYMNNIIQNYGQKKAEVYYYENYRKKEMKKQKQNIITKENKDKNIKLIKSFFSDSIKNYIEKTPEKEVSSYIKVNNNESINSSNILSNESYPYIFNPKENTLLNIIKAINENNNKIKIKTNLINNIKKISNEFSRINTYFDNRHIIDFNKDNSKKNLYSFKKLNEYIKNLKNSKNQEE